MGDETSGVRLDKWLWYARFFKTRSLSARLVRTGRVRINADPVTKPAARLSVGDTLTFPQGTRIRIARVLALGTRRGPAAEAQALYEDLSPPPQPKEPGAPEIARGQGRPTKAARRALDRLRDR